MRCGVRSSPGVPRQGRTVGSAGSQVGMLLVVMQMQDGEAGSTSGSTSLLPLQLPQAQVPPRTGSAVKPAVSRCMWTVTAKIMGCQHSYLHEELLCWVIEYFSMCSRKYTLFLQKLPSAAPAETFPQNKHHYDWNTPSDPPAFCLQMNKEHKGTPSLLGPDFGLDSLDSMVLEVFSSLSDPGIL